MNNKTKLFLGIAAPIATSVLALINSYSTSKKLDTFMDGMDKLSDGIDVDIPDKIVNTAMNEAAKKAANQKAAEAAKAVKAHMFNTVDEKVKESVGDVTPEIRKRLEEQISMVDIADIKSEVIKKAAGIVTENVSFPSFMAGKSSAAEIIEACTKAGMSSWQIENILNAAKE